MIKVQLTLTDQEATILTHYGDNFGFNLSKTAKFFISKAAEEIFNIQPPVYKLSEKTEQAGLDAIAQHKSGKTKKVDDVETFFHNL